MRHGTARVALVALALVAGCSTQPVRRGSEPAARATPGPVIASATPPRKSGGYYLDDGPGENPPPNLDLLPDAIPKVEKFASGANRPYNVFGVDYVPDLTGTPYRQRGVGSWYGRKFHGQRTSSGEIYDMYAMTAAHPTLPIPSYALVTNVQSGRSVIVRVNDRGPFLHNRIMDLSYAAAAKVGYLSSGSGLIEVEMLMPADIVAGRIPITTNSVLIAAAGARTPAVDPFGVPTTIATTVSPVVVPLAATSLPAAGTALPSSYAERGIPPDLIPDVQAPARLPEVATASGFYVQLGAFRVRAGADSFASHVTREIDPGIAAKVHVSESGAGLFRVRIGPYAQRVEADSAADSLRSAIAQPVVVLPDGIAR